jgi:hypothetical protein
MAYSSGATACGGRRARNNVHGDLDPMLAVTHVKMRLAVVIEPHRDDDAKEAEEPLPDCLLAFPLSARHLRPLTSSLG